MWSNPDSKLIPTSKTKLSFRSTTLSSFSILNDDNLPPVQGQHLPTQHKFGTAMGSPVSPVITWSCISYGNRKPSQAQTFQLWRRYVDDILEIIKLDQVDNLTEHLHSTEPTPPPPLVASNLHLTLKKCEGNSFPRHPYR